MQKTITITEGDDARIAIALLLDGQPEPVAGWSFWFTARTDYGEPVFIEKSTATTGILPGDAVTVIAKIDAADTKGKPGIYIYDIQAKSPAGEINTLETGKLVITREVTTDS